MTTQTNTKPWYKSKTIWLNIIIAIATMTMILAGNEYWGKYAEPLLMINALANAALRIITSDRIE